MIEYIYLDKLERKNFLNSNHEYLISNIQSTTDITLSSTKNLFKLPFLNPCSKIIWRLQMDYNFDNNDLFNYSNTFSDSEIEQKYIC